MTADNSASLVDSVFELGYLASEVENYLAPDEEAFFEKTLPTEERRLEHYRDVWEWAAAPILPLSEHGRDPVFFPEASRLDDDELARELRRATDFLVERKHDLAFADHLSDRVVYVYVTQSILKTQIKRLATPRPTHWDFRFVLPNGRTTDDPARVHLTFYADDATRVRWAESESATSLPPKRVPEHRRDYAPFVRRGADFC